MRGFVSCVWLHYDLMSSLGALWRPRSSKTGPGPLAVTAGTVPDVGCMTPTFAIPKTLQPHRVSACLQTTSGGVMCRELWATSLT